MVNLAVGELALLEQFHFVGAFLFDADGTAGCFEVKEWSCFGETAACDGTVTRKCRMIDLCAYEQVQEWKRREG